MNIFNAMNRYSNRSGGINRFPFETQNMNAADFIVQIEVEAHNNQWPPNPNKDLIFQLLRSRFFYDVGKVEDYDTFYNRHAGITKISPEYQKVMSHDFILMLKERGLGIFLSNFR